MTGKVDERESVFVCVCWYIMSEFNQKNENKERGESKKERLLHFSALFEEEKQKVSNKKERR